MDHITCEMQVKNVCSKYAPEAQCQAPVGVSTERFGGDVGGSLVAVDHPRHDARRVPDLQAIYGVLRGDRDEHPGRSLAPADCEWNRHRGARPAGRTEADLPADRERDRSEEHTSELQ